MSSKPIEWWGSGRGGAVGGDAAIEEWESGGGWGMNGLKGYTIAVPAAVAIHAVIHCLCVCVYRMWVEKTCCLEGVLGFVKMRESGSVFANVYDD